MKLIENDVDKHKAIFNPLIFVSLALFLSSVQVALAGDNLLYVHPKTLSPTVKYSFSPVVVSMSTNTIYVSQPSPLRSKKRRCPRPQTAICSHDSW